MSTQGIGSSYASRPQFGATMRDRNEGAAAGEGLKRGYANNAFHVERTRIVSPSIGERVARGIGRTLSKTFLRPRGYLELLSGIATGGISTVAFLAKHFAEGFLGVNSLFVSRKMKFTPKFHNRNNQFDTLSDMFNKNPNPEYVKKHAQ